MLRLGFIVVVLVAAAAFFTRPGPAEVEHDLREALLERLLTTEVEEGRDILGNAVIMGCKLDAGICYEMLRSGLKVTYDNRYLFAKVTVEGFARHAECFAAFTQLRCGDGFRRVRGG